MITYNLNKTSNISQATLFNKKENFSHSFRTEIPNIIFDLDLDCYEFKVYSILKSIAGDKGLCYASHKTLAKQSKVSEREVIKVLKKLATPFKKINNSPLIKITKRTSEYGSQTNLISICDIWGLNQDHFNSKYPKQGGVHNMHQGGAQYAPKEDLFNNNNNPPLSPPCMILPTSSPEKEEEGKNTVICLPFKPISKPKEKPITTKKWVDPSIYKKTSIDTREMAKMEFKEQKAKEKLKKQVSSMVKDLKEEEFEFNYQKLKTSKSKIIVPHIWMKTCIENDRNNSLDLNDEKLKKELIDKAYDFCQWLKREVYKIKYYQGPKLEIYADYLRIVRDKKIEVIDFKSSSCIDALKNLKKEILGE